MAYGEASSTLTAKAPDTVQSVTRDFDPLVQRIFKMASEIDMLGDRLEGSRPQDAGAAAPDTPPHSLLDELQRKRVAFDHAIMLCESGLQRLNRALGYDNAAMGQSIRR